MVGPMILTNPFPAFIRQAHPENLKMTLYYGTHASFMAPSKPAAKYGHKMDMNEHV